MIMHDLSIMLADEDAPRAPPTLLLQHFSELSDDREPARIMYPLAEVLLLVTCATIASCDDFDESWPGVRTILVSCAASRSFISAFPASAGCVAWSFTHRLTS
jgi:hypothetical protein